MKTAIRTAVRSLAAILLVGAAAQATPSTNIWNPNTDIQPKGTLHLGLDSYFSLFKNSRNPVHAPLDIGLTYGVGYGFEVGIDVFEPTVNPVQFNFKWGLPEHKSRPAFAIGVQNIGLNKNNQPNILYGLASKVFDPYGRFTVGPYVGRKSALGRANMGFIAAWDRSFGDKWWASVDYAFGRNAYGATSFAASYKFAPNVGLLFGYVIFNDHRVNPNNTATLQLDIDI